MHTAQHLAKGQVKSTEAGLNIGAPVPRLAVVMSLVPVCMILFVRCNFAGLHARMPRCVCQRNLLRGEQQQHAQVMEEAAVHCKRQNKASLAGRLALTEAGKTILRW